MSNINTNGGIVESIKAAIGNYLKKNLNMSLRGIASRDDLICREYVRKLAKGEIREDKLDQEQVLRILSVLSNKKKLTEIANSFDQNIKIYLKNAFEILFENNFEISSEEVNNIIQKDETAAVVYILAANHGGVSVKMLLDILGNRGLIKAEELVQNNILIKDSNHFMLNENKVVSFSMATAKCIFTIFSKFFNQKHLGQNRNHLIVLTESLSPKALSKKKEIYKRFNAELNEFNSDKNNHGTEPSFDICMMDTFNSEENRGESDE